MAKTKTRFRYEKRTKEDVKKRAAQSGGLFDSIFQSKFQTFTPKEGDYRLRFLPPTWDDPQHFGLDVYVHYGIGSDSQSYLCLEKMKGEKCPICEEKKRAERAGDADYARQLTATKRVLVWVVNRDDEDAGPLLWSMAWTIDRDLANLSIDKRTGEYLALDDPEEGYDVEFSRTGKGLKTKYVGVQVARKPSPLADDADLAEDWLKFITENPLTEVLQFFDYDHIEAVAKGVKEADDEEEEDEPPNKSKARQVEDDDDDDDEPPKRSAKAKDRPADDDDDDDDEPPKKSSRSRAEPSNDEDDDDDDDDDDEDDPRPTRRPPKTTSRSDEDDDDDDDDDEDEDEQPKKAVKSKSRPADDDDEDDDDEDNIHVPPKKAVRRR
jgi:hypothetical protein